MVQIPDHSNNHTLYPPLNCLACIWDIQWRYSLEPFHHVCSCIVEDPHSGGEVPEGRQQLVNGERAHVGTEGERWMSSGSSGQGGGREGLPAIWCQHAAHRQWQAEGQAGRHGTMGCNFTNLSICRGIWNTLSEWLLFWRIWKHLVIKYIMVYYI